MTRLFHVSEESGIAVFMPRAPDREGLDKTKKLVWSINEQRLPNYLTPRDCPRVTYHARANTTPADIKRFFSSSSRHCVAIENSWFERMANTILYIYELAPTNFLLQDEVAGYYVSEQAEIPLAVTKIRNVFDELFKRDVEVRLVNNLWSLSQAVISSSLNYSICRMKNAKPERIT